MDYSLGMLHGLEQDMDAALQRISDTLKLKDMKDLKSGSIVKKTVNKDVLAGFVEELVGYCLKSKDVFRSTASQIDQLKSDQLINQKLLISAQGELIKKKDEQLGSVNASVKKELKSWSDVVKQSCSQHITPKRLKEAVKSAAVEEDRSRSFMIFEEVEDKDMTDSDIVEAVLDCLDEKPLVQACYRVGTPGNGKRVIRVQLSSSEIVQVILRKAKNLRNIKGFEKTFLGPDRTSKERAEHRKLVEEMKKLIKDQPEKHFFIRNKKICCADKLQSEEKTAS